MSGSSNCATNKRRRSWLAVLLLLPLPLHILADDTQYLQSLRNTHYERVDSTVLGRPLHIYTMLPDSYTQESESRYPTIYILDGGALFPLLTGYYRYLHFNEEAPDAIIVGISYGADDFEGGNFRSTDFTAPSDERDYWGGAERFQRFLAEELLPRVESRYRSDVTQRIIFGHSLGGQFVLFTAQTQPELFHGHIASNPALHRNLEFFLSSRPQRTSRSNLFVASGTRDEQRFRTPLLEWVQHWSGVEPKPWRLKVLHLEGHTHMSAPPASFRQGLSWLKAVDDED
jgi:predicted alpha/beta superfamily hydrolase